MRRGDGTEWMTLTFHTMEFSSAACFTRCRIVTLLNGGQQLEQPPSYVAAGACHDMAHLLARRQRRARARFKYGTTAHDL